MGNIGLRLVREAAFGVKDHQFFGAPPWIDAGPFDIAAKADGDPPDVNWRVRWFCLSFEDCPAAPSFNGMAQRASVVTDAKVACDDFHQSGRIAQGFGGSQMNGV